MFIYIVRYQWRAKSDQWTTHTDAYADRTDARYAAQSMEKMPEDYRNITVTPEYVYPKGIHTGQRE